MFEKNSENYYSQEGKTLVETLEGDFSINNVFNPINLGAKWKLLISRFQNSPWMLHLQLNWQRYDRKTEPNLNRKKSQTNLYL